MKDSARLNLFFIATPVMEKPIRQTADLVFLYHGGPLFGMVIWAPWAPNGADD